MAGDKKQHLPTGGSSAKATSYFYNWEKRGRGWSIYPHRVDIEPDFEAFLLHDVPFDKPADDARKPSAVSSLWRKIKGMTASQKTEGNRGKEPVETPSAPADHGHHQDHGGVDHDLVEIGVILPPDQKVTPDIAEQFLLNLSNCTSPIAFEVIGTSLDINIRVVSSRSDQHQVQQQIAAYFPLATYEIKERALEACLDFSRHTVIVDFGLKNEFLRPLKSPRSFEPDPLTGVVGALEGLQKLEVGILQIVFVTVKGSWSDSIIRSVVDREGKPFFIDAPEVVGLAREKVKGPLLASIIRLVGQSDDKKRAWEIVRSLGSGLKFLSDHNNELIPLTNKDYNDRDHELDILHRQTHRSGMILNCKELCSLVHFPSSSVQSMKLNRLRKRTKAAPATTEGHPLILGENTHKGITKPVTVSIEARMRHMVKWGATGVGKSFLDISCALQDIKNGFGVIFLDPHDDSVNYLMGLIPEERYDDVIIFSPSDEDFPIALNILSANTEIERNVLASDLTSIFRNLSTSFGDQMDSLMSYLFLTFLTSEKGGTLIDVVRFLLEKDFREDFLKTVNDLQILYYWKREFPLLIGKPIAPVLTRLNNFLRPRIIRNMVAQERGLDFHDIFNSKKIFLAKLSPGLIGQENSKKLGNLILSKVLQATLGRQSINASERVNCYLYIDEAHHFITPSLKYLLTSSRKYSLSVSLSFQDLRQLKDADAQVASAIIANPYIKIYFRLGHDDAKKISRVWESERLSQLWRNETTTLILEHSPRLKLMLRFSKRNRMS